MASTPEVVEPPKEEAIVYFVVSPDSGPGQRIYTDEDIQALGGIHTIEQALENESYWYVRLGEIQGEAGRNGVTFLQSDFGQLPPPPESGWKPGRCNPSFRGSELERRIFKTAFQAVCSMLDAWKRIEDGDVLAYALKELKISTKRLMTLARSLQTLPRIHDIAEITVIKYWYDRSWPEPQFPDLVLAEFSLNIPLQVRRSLDREMLTVEILPMARC